MAKVTIATPIYYVNGAPHLGSAYTTAAADTLARYYRQQGDEVLFSTGVDENSQKTVQAAEAAKQPVKQYLDDMAERWQQTFDDLEIKYDKFVRTTSPEHIKAVDAFMELIKKSGDITEGVYEGLYCTSCEEFKRPEELIDGKCPIHHTEPEKIKEKNYFFKLSKYQQPLLQYIQDNPEFVQPVSRRNEIVAFIERGLDDISITREGKQFGLRYPFDKDQVIYVWIEALINYLTVTGYPVKSYEEHWPTTVNIIGKDISKFHCVYWPALLMSAGLPLPKQVYVHGFLTADGKKMGKSAGNTIDPIELAKTYGVEPVRFYLLRETPFGADGNFSEERLREVYETDLANELGNLVQRVVVMTQKYQDGALGEVPPHSHDIEPYHAAMRGLRFDKAIAEIWNLVRGLNQYIDEEKPWQLAKRDAEQLADVLAHVATDLRQVAEMLMPFMPVTAERILASFEGDKVHGDVGILFPKSA